MGAVMICNNCKGTILEKGEYIIDSYDKKDLESTDSKKEKNERLQECQKDFETKILEYGEIINNEEIEKIIYEKNKNINSEFRNINQEEILDKTSDTTNNYIFNEPPIKFKKDGTIYYGSWNCNFQKEGFGITINPDGSVYKGLYKQDSMNKFGIFIDKDGNYYKGDFKDGKKNGKGELFIKNIYKYNGDFNEDFQDGKGREESFKDGSIYEGNFIKGLKNGKGKLIFQDGTFYIGDFKNGKYDGNGLIKYSNGQSYEGEFRNNKLNGKGVFNWGDGKMYIGNYLNNKKHGFGKLKWNDDKFYEGYWINNKQHGNGFYYINGNKIRGIFRFGQLIMKK
jgi:hypothetical protein